MDGGVTDEQANRWLQEIAEGDPIYSADQTLIYSGSWVSLHYDNPALNGVERAELTGGGYVRFKMIWSPPQDRIIWSTIDARFSGLQQTKILYYGVWSLQYGGFLRAYAELAEPASVLAGRGYVLPEKQLAVSFG
jgi:hypothetical protein